MKRIGNRGAGAQAISCYLGNIHLAPISRLWKTNKLDRVTQTVRNSEGDEQQVLVKFKTRGSSNAEPRLREIPFKAPVTMDYTSVCQMDYNLDEKAEVKIAKQALLEALFQSQLWSEPYVKNPFIYVTDVESDFTGEDGIKLKDYFTKVFYSQYQKYKAAVDSAIREEAYRERDDVTYHVRRWEKYHSKS